MDDTTWAVEMADRHISPDEFLDALRDAREMGREEFSNEVIGRQAAELIDSNALDPLINALLISAQAFDSYVGAKMVNGPITVTIEVNEDAQAE